MGYSFRKSIKLGSGTRLNFSKSGVGISYGIKGFRVSTNSKDSTLYAGRKGVYYRKKLSSSTNLNAKDNEILENETPDEILDIADEFESFVNISDSYMSSEYNEFQKKVKILSLILKICFFSGFFLYFIPWLIGTYVYFKKWKALENDRLKIVKDEFWNKLFGIFEKVIVNEKIYSAGDLSICQIGVGKCNYISEKCPMIKFKGASFYFTNNGLICVTESAKGYFVPYSDIEIQKVETKIMTFSPPSDAEIVGSSWEHVNKNGSPNKRYKINREIFEVKSYVGIISCKDNFSIPLLFLTEQACDSVINSIVAFTDS